MKYVAIFHANLNYAFLEPHKYEQVIRASYETIVDTFRECAPRDARYVFEASGFTIDQIAKRTPDVLAKLRAAIESGQCEFMGAPYAHPIMANVPEEDGRWSCRFAMDAYERHLGFRPESFWNPECTWRQYVPRAFRDAGAKYLTLDFESYMISSHRDYAWVERNRTRDMNWGGHLPWYELDPDCPYLHRPFRDVVPGLHGMCRSDRLVGKYIGYFLGRLPLEEYIANVKHWTGTRDEGSTIIIADDAEYCGTTGYFFVKHFRDYTRSFAVDPGARGKLERLIAEVLKLGELATFRDACAQRPVEEPYFVEDGFAWHRTYADAWAGTPEARAWDPVLSELRRAYREEVAPVAGLPAHAERLRPKVERFWFHLANAANSDGRWPPPPAETCPFNRQWVLDEIAAARRALAALRRAVKGLPCPAPLPEEPGPDWQYGFAFTEKDPSDVRRLNDYELQHAIYHFHRMVDGRDAAKSDEGRRQLRRVFDELDRRGMKGVRPPSIRA